MDTILKVNDVEIRLTEFETVTVGQCYDWKCPRCGETQTSEKRPRSSKEVHCSPCWLLHEEEVKAAEEQRFFRQYPYMKEAKVVGIDLSFGDLNGILLETFDGRLVLVYIEHGWERGDEYLGMEFQ